MNPAVKIVLLLLGAVGAVYCQSVNDTCECVPQFQCTYKGVITEDGEGLIDIRNGLVEDNPLRSRRKCPSYLESCCLPPEIKPTFQQPSPKRTNGEPQNTGVNGPHVTRGCGRRNPKGIGFRITGAFNNEANFAEFPWTVAIMLTESVTTGPQYTCGGSLIHKRVVLTGAHCVHGRAPSDLVVRAGEWDTQTENEPLPHQDREVGAIEVHPGFRKGPLFNNFALLVLAKPFDLADNVETVCLPEAGEVFDRSRCFATGWGKDKYGKEGHYQVILKAVELPVVSHHQCQSTFRHTELGRYFKLHYSFLCAGGERDVDTCTGDGGNALVCPLAEDPTRYTQAGIVSWGLKCGRPGIPGVYADVTKARDWIDETLTNNYKISTSSYLVGGENDVPNSNQLDIRVHNDDLKPSGQIVIATNKFNKEFPGW